jgi:hypothetical protein
MRRAGERRGYGERGCITGALHTENALARRAAAAARAQIG